MLLTLSSPPATRLRQLLVLLLVALGLLAGVSVSQGRDAEAQTIHTEAVLLPALQQVHDLASRVDEQRGMAALHITLHINRHSGTERQALEGRLRASRQQVERHMVALGQRPAGDTDRQLQANVQAGLAGFWVAQDKLLAASRRAALDPAAADLARSLLSGEAQQAFDHLRADIEAWWAEIERAAAQVASQARADARHAALVAWALALLAALALAVGWAVLRQPLPWLLALGFGLWAVQHFALIVWLPTMLKEQRGLSSGWVALLTCVMLLACVPGNLLGGVLVQRGVARGRLLTLAHTATGLTSLAFFLDGLPDGVRYAACVACSFIGGVMPAAVMSSSAVLARSPRQINALQGLFIQGSQLGQFAGTPLIAAVVAASGRWSSAGWVSASAALMGVALGLVVWRIERGQGAAR